MKNLIIKKRKMSLRLIILFIIILSLNPLIAQVVNGRIHLSDLKKIYTLNGTWVFAPHDDLHNKELNNMPANSGKIRVPGVWQKAGLQKCKYGLVYY